MFLVPRQDLTPEQLRVVELPTDSHKLILGPPGSGKTVLLVHRAAYLMARQRVPPERFRVLVFTNALKEYIRSGVDFLGLPIRSVSTFDSWCRELQRQFVRGFAGDSSDPNYFETVRSAVLESIQSSHTPPILDFAMVDEGQDLTATAYSILRIMCKHVTVFADPHQRIFDGVHSEEDILSELGIRRRSVALLSAYRNSPDVAALASWFLPDLVSRSNYLAQARNLGRERERPLLYLAPDNDSEMDRLAQSIRQRLSMNQRVGIIVPRTADVHGVSSALHERGIAVEKVLPPSKAVGGGNPPDFGSSTPKIVTYHSAKGLTFDTVFLPCLVRGAFASDDPETIRRLIFVGVARATQWVCFTSIEGMELPELQVLYDAERDKQVIIQRGRPAPFAQSDSTHVFDDEADIL